ncbi:Rossmann-fold NAD(P)-binding domain-containing protein [Wolbachia endosymbiont of Litomosoides sigmodontis]|uniref:hypothetical protein n=1 Tax=Wolbachia endosymbiont of Litomosoides sigmodontis TaxID=80850 RepID=UPI001FE427C8|nr:hypothetical protein [Wolbachia endosymbiont of Litomosoides sigmodontis]
MIKRVVIFGETRFSRKTYRKMFGNSWIFNQGICCNQEKAAWLKLCGNLGQMSIFKGDLFDEESLLESVGGVGCDVVINLVGISYEVKKHGFYVVHVEIAEKIAGAAKIKNVPMMIHFSAMGIEISKMLKFTQSKLGGEKAVIAAFSKVVIIKPSPVFSKKDNFFTKFISNYSSFLTANW